MIDSRAGGDARDAVHPRRSDILEAGDFADPRYLRIYPNDAGVHPGAVLRCVPTAVGARKAGPARRPTETYPSK